MTYQLWPKTIAAGDDTLLWAAGWASHADGMSIAMASCAAFGESPYASSGAIGTKDRLLLLSYRRDRT
jgi:hypothetical protein